MKWWQILGVGLILYSLIVGMIVPLGSGITDVYPAEVHAASSTTLKVTGYNSNFEDASKSSAWIKLNDSLGIPASNVVAISQNEVEFTFDLLGNLPVERDTNLVSLVVHNEIDGISVLPSAIRLFNKRDTTGIVQPATAFGALSRATHKTFPYRNLLKETIRNTFYHIPMWFAMVIIFAIAVFYSAKQLSNPMPKYDHLAVAFTGIGLLYGILGTVTGALWAKHTWGAYWSWDPKQNVSAIALLIYCAYFILRNSFDDPERSARLSAVYNIFAFAAMIPLIFVVPRLTSSLHPGNGGNPGMGGEDLDNTMRFILYPAVIGWILLGCWMANVRARILDLKDRLYAN